MVPTGASTQHDSGSNARGLVLILVLVMGTLAFSSPQPAQAAAGTALVAVPGHPASVLAGSVTEGSAGVTFLLPRLRSTTTFGVDLRRQADGDWYQARVRITSAGQATLELVRRNAWHDTRLSSKRLGTVKKGQHLRVEGEVSGGSKVVLEGRAFVVEGAGTSQEARYVDSSKKRVSARGTTSATVRLAKSASKRLSVQYSDFVVLDQPVVPDTRLVRDDSSPSKGPVSPGDIRYRFDSTTPDATFDCSLDGNPFAACLSPLELTDVSDGTHTLRVRTTSYIGVVDPTPAEADFHVGGPMQVKPSASTTGVPTGTHLTVHEGDLVVNTAGARLDALDVHGAVIIKAANVTITRSIVRGGPDPKQGSALIVNYGYPGLLIEDTDVVPSFPSVNTDGIKGWGFTARRVHVVGGVDSIKVHGDDVLIEDSLLENTTWYPHDPYQNDGPTHNDNVQILMGHNISIIGNTIRGATNFAVLGAANKGDALGLRVEANWLDGGHCTVKFQSMGSYRLTTTLLDNKFGPNRAVSYCPVQAEPQVDVTDRGNVFEDTGKPVAIYRGR